MYFGPNTRPITGRMLKQLFDTIGDINERAFLDLFAGTGAVSFEALKRGAKTVECVEIDYKCCAAIKKLNQFIVVHKKNALSVKIDKKFDITFLDPPYNKNLISPTLKNLQKYSNFLEILVIKSSKHEKFDIQWAKNYKAKSKGESVLSFWRTY